ncbi:MULTISPECIES: hypothetical protein [Methylobacterium]|uniref:Uncharacterized protein n=3 Tax=Pseudomonadota TaxID=1224 RepID=A0ABQ4SS20_9HYPH|nr:MULTISPECIES: hypothetical protein [Methylobacterium]PIU04284.1 MAG: hypothetical protein COT56_20995 [Methylobacterium sp. CG09_land_8_20_14_0_10_71_15]PIU13047.1 MAG: hypothetical protein COT28_13295 [Methylobacterium sp. CG08_land_8_20_14_0_20_71_15]GJE05263.1 hypothetical protein AOPFMNJM_0561 [Methylobacterium jeotgali]
MIYVSPDLHREMKLVALDEDRSASDVYGEAVRAYLGSRGVRIGQARRRPAAQQATAAELAEAIDRQGRRIEDLHAAVAAVTGSQRHDTQEPSGTKAAVAMKAVLAQLKAAGTDGMDGRDLSTAVYAAGIRSGAVDGAKTVLRAAGLIHFDAKRWYLDGA